MKKRLILLVIILLSIEIACADIRINEVELNPAGDDNKYEWIELYSSAQVNLANWLVLSSNGRNLSFNASFQGYYVLTTPYNFLTNKENSLTLKDEFGAVIDIISPLTDNNNNDYSWQYCLNNWTFTNSSKEQENNCYKNLALNIQINTSNTTSPQNKTPSVSSIKIIKNAPSTNLNQETIPSEVSDVPNSDNPPVIVLGKSSQNNKKTTQIENSIIYKSKNEYIKEYMPYAFSLLCIILMALLAIDRNKIKITKDND